MYRPMNFKNPYDAEWDIAQNMIDNRLTFEAGADAMLEALKREGKHTNGLAPTLSIHVLPEQKGWLVFIPDEVSKE